MMLALYFIVFLLSSSLGSATYVKNNYSEKGGDSFLDLYIKDVNPDGFYQNKPTKTFDEKIKEFNEMAEMFLFLANEKSYLEDGIYPGIEEDEEATKQAKDTFDYMKSMPLSVILFLKNVSLETRRKMLTQEEFEKLIEDKKKIKEDETLQKSLRGVFDPEDDSDFVSSMAPAVKKLNSLLKDGDVLIVPGNTGRYLAIALEAFTDKKITIVPLAISGTPGMEKTGDEASFEWVRNILTPKGLENYDNYIKEHLSSTLKNLKSGQKIYFLDIVSGGYGLNFLLDRINTIVSDSDIKQPDINLINIDKFSPSRLSKGKLQLPTYLIDPFDLNAPELARDLDTIGYDDRLAPDFPAYLWDDWDANDPSQYTPTKKALVFAKNIKEYFTTLKEKERTDVE